MATSNSFNFSVTRDDIIKMAMLFLGQLGEGQTPTPQETQDCSRVLNMIVKQLQGDADFSSGIKQWTRRTGHLFLSNKTGQYNIGPSGDNWTNSYVTTSVSTASIGTTLNVVSAAGISTGNYIGIQVGADLFWTTVNGAPVGNVITLAQALPSTVSSGVVFAYAIKAQQPLVIETVNLREYSNTDTLMRQITRTMYDQFPSRVDPTNVGDPNFVYVENQLTNSVLYLDCAGASDVTKHLVISYMESVQDFVNPLDNPEYPQEYFLFLTWMLAKHIAPMFNAPWTQEMQLNYTESAAVARNKDVDTTVYYFQPGIYR
jgi:hypothetical protein